LDYAAFLRRHCLPAGYAAIARACFEPLARHVGQLREQQGKATLVLGINGAQGTGKSTLSRFLGEYLEDRYDLRVAELSLDDIYLTRAERERLAATVHPLLATRGVPGTHDVGLGRETVDRLCRLERGENLRLPRFDKALDDRLPESSWPVVGGPVDVVIFEGWCVCSSAVAEEALVVPLNDLERDEDSDGRWRRHVNTQLATAYTELFTRVDTLVYLQAPGFEAIRRWRLEQEHKLAASAARGSTRVMNDAEVQRFIQHFERITRQDLERLPARADIVISLDEDHSVSSMRSSGKDLLRNL